MRPAVYASVVRNRKSNARRIRLGAPIFSIRRLLVMVFVGALLLAPGLTLTILGLDDVSDPYDSQTPAQRALYKVIGPVSLAFGVFILFTALLYYFCYGLADQSQRSRHPSAKSVSHGHGHSTLSSVRSDKTHDGRSSNDTEENSRHRSSSKSSESPHRPSHHHSHHHHNTQHKRQASQSKGDDCTKPTNSREINVCVEDEHAPLSSCDSFKPSSDL